MQQIAALNMYTKENLGQPGLSFHSVLNRALHSRDRSAIANFLPYLRLFLDAASQLPNAGPCKLWRGLRQQPAGGEEAFPIGSYLHWWGISSATRNSRVLANPRFFGSSGARTLFSVECINGVDISAYSDFPEEEVLLMPGARFQVEQTMPPEISSGILQIILKQVECRHDLLTFPIEVAARNKTPQRELEWKPATQPKREDTLVDADAKLAAEMQAAFDVESEPAEQLMPTIQVSSTSCSSSLQIAPSAPLASELTGQVARPLRDIAGMLDDLAAVDLSITGFPAHAEEANGRYSYAGMYGGRP